jgi:hypothetical protein
MQVTIKVYEHIQMIEGQTNLSYNEENGIHIILVTRMLWSQLNWYVAIIALSYVLISQSSFSLTLGGVWRCNKSMKSDKESTLLKIL